MKKQFGTFNKGTRGAGKPAQKNSHSESRTDKEGVSTKSNTHHPGSDIQTKRKGRYSLTNNQPVYGKAGRKNFHSPEGQSQHPSQYNQKTKKYTEPIQSPESIKILPAATLKKLPHKTSVNEFKSSVSVQSGNELIYGINPIESMLSVGKRWIFQTYYAKSKENLIRDFLSRYPKFNQSHPIEKTNEELTTIVGTDNHQGIVVECAKFPLKTPDDLWTAAKYSSSFIALDNIHDPQNVGTIIRSSLFFGIREFIIPENKSSPINATVAKTSAGILEQAKIYQVVNLSQTLIRMKKEGYWIMGTSTTGKEISKITVPDKYVLVMGNEKTGMRRLIEDSCDFTVAIRGSQNVDSLNVSSACSIMLYHMTQNKIYGSQ